MIRFLNRLGDRINPIVVKETRQAVNSRIVATFLLLFLTIELVVMVLLITERESAGADEVNLAAGRDVFLVVQGILVGACMILIPTMTGVRLAVERSDVNVDLLFISSLSPRAVVFGKLMAAAALALLMFSAAAPFMTFAYVLRGLDLPTIFLVLLADFLGVVFSTSFLVFLASIPANRGLRMLLGVPGLVGISYIGAGLLAGSSGFLEEGLPFDMSTGEFWLGVAGLAFVILACVGLFFVWSVALVSPPAANRAHAVRLYTTIVWLLEGVGCTIWSEQLKRQEPLVLWGLVGMVWFSLQMLIATSERDSWGPRVARTIPRSPLRRCLAFLYYSGAAGGFLFGFLGCAASVAAIALAEELYPTMRGNREPMWEAAALIGGYTFCYCQSGIVLRRLVGGAQFRIGASWLLAVILFGFGCAIPFMLAFALFDRYHSPLSDVWFYMTNPFITIEDARRPNSQSLLTMAFLLVWGGAVSLVNLPWFLRQVMRFRRKEKGEGE